jgi:hypothetical protein
MKINDARSSCSGAMTPRGPAAERQGLWLRSDIVDLKDFNNLIRPCAEVGIARSGGGVGVVDPVYRSPERGSLANWGALSD